MLAEIVAKPAMADDLQGIVERLREAVGARAISLQQVICHTQGRFRPHTRKAAQGFDQSLKGGRVGHDSAGLEGSFI